MIELFDKEKQSLYYKDYCIYGLKEPAVGFVIREWDPSEIDFWGVYKKEEDGTYTSIKDTSTLEDAIEYLNNIKDK
jgi:hypothetical protein